MQIHRLRIRVQQCGSALCSSSCSGCRSRGRALAFLAPALRAQRGLVLQAVALHGPALEHASADLRADVQVAKAVIRVFEGCREEGVEQMLRLF